MKHLLAAVLAMLVAAALAAPALADSTGKTTLGPAGYNGPGAGRTLVVAGTANVVLGDGDHVVICHAIGGPNGSRFNQIAPSATGVASGHGDHEGDRDIIPPFTLRTDKGSDTSLVAGRNWTAANAAIYANGCSAPPSTPPATPPTVPAPPATPPTIVIEKVEIHTTTVVVKTVKAKAKKAKRAKKVVKAKKKAQVEIKVKAAHKVFKPHVLPHTR